MDFYRVIRRRRMVRRYTAEPVPAATIQRILQAGRSAPSAGNSRAQRFVVITDPGVRARIAAAAGEAERVAAGRAPWITSAPVLIVPLVSVDAYRRRYGEPDKAESASPDEWTVPYWWVDGGASLMALLLAAAAEGLGAGFLGGHAVPGLRDVIGADPDDLVLGVVTVGRPHPESRPGLSAARLEPEGRVRWLGPASAATDNDR